MDLISIQQEAYKTAKEHGFWDEPRNDGEMIALMHSELSEALEWLRKKDMSEEEIMQNVMEEMADCTIRILDFCESKNMNLEEAICNKMNVNQERPYKHGKKF